MYLIRINLIAKRYIISVSVDCCDVDDIAGNQYSADRPGLQNAAQKLAVGGAQEIDGRGMLLVQTLDGDGVRAGIDAGIRPGQVELVALETPELLARSGLYSIEAVVG